MVWLFIFSQYTFAIERESRPISKRLASTIRRNPPFDVSRFDNPQRSFSFQANHIASVFCILCHLVGFSNARRQRVHMKACRAFVGGLMIRGNETLAAKRVTMHSTRMRTAPPNAAGGFSSQGKGVPERQEQVPLHRRAQLPASVPPSSVWKVWYVEQWIKMGQTRALSELFQTCHSGVAMRSVSEAPLTSGVPREVTFEYVALRYDSSNSPYASHVFTGEQSVSRHACAAPEREGGSARLALFGVLY